MQLNDLPQRDVAHQARRRYNSWFFCSTRCLEIVVPSRQQIRDCGPGQVLRREAETFRLLAQAFSLRRRQVDGDFHVCTVPSRRAVQQQHGRADRPGAAGRSPSTLGGCAAYEHLGECGFEEFYVSAHSCLRCDGLSMCSVTRDCAPCTRRNGCRRDVGRSDSRCGGHRGELVSTNTFWQSLEAKKRLQDHH